MRLIHSCALALLYLTAVPATAATPALTLEQVMADPDWIGPPVEEAWWAWDGRSVQYLLKRDGQTIRDTWQQTSDGNGAAVRVDGADRAQLDAAQPAYDNAHARMAFIRNGDVFVRDLRSGLLTQLTRTDAEEALPQWSSDGGLVWRVGNAWYRWAADRGVQQAAVIKAEKDPEAPAKSDSLRDRQLALMRTLRDDKAQRDAAREQQNVWNRTDPSRAPPPVYLGDDVDIADSALSPDGRWLLVVTTTKGAAAGETVKLPQYVTESGLVEVKEGHTVVGRNAPLPHSVWLVAITIGKARKLSFDTLPGIASDPLASLRKAAGRDPLKGNRDVRIETDGDGSGPAIHWSADSRDVALLVRAVDNKDRWIATVDTADASVHVRQQLHDAAWINWNFNDFGWMPDVDHNGHHTLWFLSEQSGWSQLHLDDGARARALTSGHWEASQPQLSADGRRFYFLCNRAQPGRYEVCAVDAGGGAVRELTALGGVEGFRESPDGSRLLVTYSGSYLPAQLAVVGTDGNGVRTLTDTRKPAFKAIDWIAPRFVQIPSRHGAGVIWGKYYGPTAPQPGQRHPIVMFVHGAGYTQNVHARYPYYFREQMFHNLLVQHGYIVLDLDYRGSEGYGRDWRTAIYRNMGHPELEDYLDGLDWLVANQQGDRAHAGIYGGSYGGFMTLMALFREPGVFKAGAALRPVSDWTLYNHEYTSNILNTPDIDPAAYRQSSPIEYAAGLQDTLLIAHGMLDDNVFFKDSVDLGQRLIELHKQRWSLAPYPMERHAFEHADAWLDEYRRIDALFESTLKQPAVDVK
jgi:dipeptidyl aminopeptidase/acylaminoacyl peptidase